ncbi:hypothetical protein BKA67DRAFT_650891 [Truncatella angustata]|uniref:Uncharacterized protein n=1 Tax=Truncatella angustata TaxID=152316 RepID=A0A9P8UCU9_9PEZI|nr:uncharacterized protein BKA67DRAFT_650891 [Truncatella angustata]KAH6646282.1 hypothetical protein BKA67DRAFT_650891 [Truncatella angustata]
MMVQISSLCAISSWPARTSMPITLRLLPFSTSLKPRMFPEKSIPLSVPTASSSREARSSRRAMVAPTAHLSLPHPLPLLRASRLPWLSHLLPRKRARSPLPLRPRSASLTRRLLSPPTMISMNMKSDFQVVRETETEPRCFQRMLIFFGTRFLILSMHTPHQQENRESVSGRGLSSTQSTYVFIQARLCFTSRMTLVWRTFVARHRHGLQGFRNGLETVYPA